MVKLLTTTTISDEAIDYYKIIADMEKNQKFVKEHPCLKHIVDYPSVINPNHKPPTPEETKKFMDFVSDLRKKFGTVFDKANNDINNLVRNEQN